MARRMATNCINFITLSYSVYVSVLGMDRQHVCTWQESRSQLGQQRVAYERTVWTVCCLPCTMVTSVSLFEQWWTPS